MSRLSEKPLISVVIPSFNAESYICEAVESVLAQTYSTLEVLIVDDGSTDSSCSLIRDLQNRDPRIKLFCLPHNTGNPSAPRNRALDEASGAYVAFLDSDDLWALDKLSSQLAIMLEHGLQFSCGFVRPFNELAELNRAYECPKGASISLLNHEELLKKNVVATSSVLVATKVLRNHRFSTEPVDLAVEDYKLWLELHQDEQVKSAFIKMVGTGYRLRGGSLSRSKYKMASRIFQFLSRYEVDGRGLGWRRYYYFVTYMLGALHSKMYRKRL